MILCKMFWSNTKANYDLEVQSKIKIDANRNYKFEIYFSQKKLVYKRKELI